MEFILFLSLGILTGCFFSIQASINSTLSRYTKTPLNASLIAFFVGSIILLTATFLWDFDQLNMLDLSYPLYTYVGGAVSGVVYNVSNIILFRKIGATNTTFLTVTSQIISGAVFDSFGFLGLPVVQLSLKRIMGIGIMLLAVFLLQKTNRKKIHKEEETEKTSYFWLMFALVAGVFPPLQAIFNGQLRSAVRSPLVATLISFLVGLIILFVVVLIVQKSINFPTKDPSGKKLPWWIYIGGAFGVIVVGGTILVVGELGSVLTSSLFLLGQIIMSSLIDQFGLFGLRKTVISRQKVISILLIILGLVIIS
ncbi:DMT family transporter [Enterococcus crotali]|uniref:DMT family transporter n=1 Tax=Enterococcus crotali TaxID=1453587 RepID=UPI000471F823|nr:DMT family transporter [Enterococcus crotali]